MLDNLADGVTVDEVLRSYPTLTAKAVRAALAYAADLSRERVIAVNS